MRPFEKFLYPASLNQFHCKFISDMLKNALFNSIRLMAQQILYRFVSMEKLNRKM